MKRSQIVILIVFLVLLLDQAVKFYIKTHFHNQEEVFIFGLDWARIHFVENEGMAFGIIFDWEYGKLLLSLFRIVMVVALIWYIRLLLRVKAPMGFVYSVGLITAGALGNIIDSAFYGLIFTESPEHEGAAQLVAMGQGYGTFLHGKVVDMFYFPITWITLPEWMPFWGGESFHFFSPIFNVADASITCGVLAILLFQRHFFRTDVLPAPPATTAAPEALIVVEEDPEALESAILPDDPGETAAATVTTGTEAPNYVEEEAPAEAKNAEPERGI